MIEIAIIIHVLSICFCSHSLISRVMTIYSIIFVRCTQWYRESDVECDEIRTHVVSFKTHVKNWCKWSFVSADHLRLDHWKCIVIPGLNRTSVMDQFWLGFCPSQVTKNDLEKLKCTYRQLSKDAVLARDKYKEAVVKGELLIYSLLIFSNNKY